MDPKTYTSNVKAAIDHVRRFLDMNKNESVTGHHDAYERLKHLSTDDDTRALDRVIVQVLNACHEYANNKEES